MLKITETFEDEKTITVRLDGSITNASFANLDEVCSRLRDQGNKTILLDFSGVGFMNEEIARRVARLRGDRIRIVNCSLFIETLLRSAEG